MKKLFENFRRYTLIEEMESLMESSINENAQEVAKYMKQLNMINKNPEQFLKKAKAKVEKKMKKAQKAMGADPDQLKKGKYADSKEAAANIADDPKGALEKINQDLDAKQDKLEKVDDLGDQAMAQAQKDPEAKKDPDFKGAMAKMEQADKAVQFIFAKIDEWQKQIMSEFNAAAQRGDQRTMQEKIQYAQGFNKWSSDFINQATSAFRKGRWDDIKPFDEVIAMAAKYGFKG